jgi:hypothetical protein
MMTRGYKQTAHICKIIVLLPAACAFLLLASPAAAGGEPAFPHLWGGFSTALTGRTAEQRGNAARAALDLDGILIAPGARFSFNGLVGARDAMKGYTPAPIIGAGGDISDIPGGGICQLATSIYNAALEAGMEIIERHPHSRAVGYVPPGRDATITTWRKDLKLRNPHRFPLLLRIRVAEGRLTAGFWSVADKPFRVLISSDIIPIEPETVFSADGQLPGGSSGKGSGGFSVVTRRIMRGGGADREETLSRDTYPAPTRILQ